MQGFRNLIDVVVQPESGLNVFEGQNGQGKTNFLEAVVLLTGQRSFRGARLKDMLQKGADLYRIEARLTGSDGEEHVVVQESSGRGRKIRLDDRHVRKASSLLELFPVVFFGPDDLEIAKGSPSNRRRFLDEGVVLCDPLNSDTLRTYQEVLKNRNRLLKDAYEPEFDERLLRVYTEQLIEYAALLEESYIRFLDVFAPEFSSTLEAMTDGKHQGRMELQKAPLFARCANQDAASMDARDKAAGTTVSGPHRVDLNIFLDGNPIQAWASQGQNRLIVIALKVALLRLVSNLRTCEPVLLLDDVSSELDQSLSDLLSGYLGRQGGQVLATTTSAEAVGFSGDDVARFVVHEGRIVRVHDGNGN
jgi:DNA replication and repair protein RecF